MRKAVSLLAIRAYDRLLAALRGFPLMLIRVKKLGAFPSGFRSVHPLSKRGLIMDTSASLVFLLMFTSLPIQAGHVIFTDGFETPPANTITSIDVYPVGLQTSIAIGSDGYPVISFGDNFAGSLRLLTCDGIKCDGGHPTIATIDVREPWVGWPSTVAIGQDGFPVIAYSGQLSPRAPLLIAKCNDLACTGGDELISVADQPEFHVGYGSSIAIGSDGFPVISHFTELEGVSSLRLTKCNDVACTGGDETNTTLQAGSGGGYTSLAIGGDGFPVIATSDGQTGQLLVVKCNDPACTGDGDVITVVADDILAYVSLALGTDGFPLIAYERNLGPSVSVIKCNDPACAGGDEAQSVVDDQGEDPGQYTTVAIGANGNPVIAYWDRVGALGQLVVASCNDSACAGGDETITVVDGPSHVGQGISLAIGSDGLPIISYLDGPYPHSLKVVHCGNPDCTP